MESIKHAIATCGRRLYCSTYSRQINQEGSLQTYKLIFISSPATSVTDTLAKSTFGLVEDHFELSELRDHVHAQDEREKELEMKLRSVLVEERG